MEAQRLKVLFDRHVQQGLDEQEYLELLKLMDTDHRGILDEQLKMLWKEALEQKADQDAEKRIRLVMEKVNRPLRKGLLRKLWWIPAAVVFLAILILFYRPFLGQSPVAGQLPHFSTVSTGPGQKKTIRLLDGTTVYLNSASSIRYGEDYNDQSRKISLEGEAFFQVVKDPGKPFIVDFRGLFTKVLGTSFNINAYPENKSAHVEVASGKVEVGKLKNMTLRDSAFAVLAPGRQLSYSFSAGKALLSDVDDIIAIGDWKQGVLRFKGEDFAQVASRLEKWYHVKIRFDHPGLKRCRFRGTFKDLSLKQVLSLLQKSGDFTFQINQQQVFIKGKGCL